uniref:Uncharacterized protein n=1 Tax=Xiphophorus couchianus TaxID=32473 RepID=A0A3B5LZN0_9TELE
MYLNMFKDYQLSSPVLLGTAWYVRVTEEDLCLGMVSRFALGPLVRLELLQKVTNSDVFAHQDSKAHLSFNTEVLSCHLVESFYRDPRQFL